MTILILGFAIIAAYLLGAIPSAVWIGIRFYGVDVRQKGSGNSGATNTFRVLGKRAGIIVMLLDIFKGLLATSLAPLLVKLGIITPDDLILYKLVCGGTAVLGHIFSIFIGFKGGKGVATLLGLMLSVHPAAVGH